ncbi:MAG: hypothetical protein GJV46_00700 [Geobacter sp.]|nr:hypothetical protein [Geobacter sp.]
MSTPDPTTLALTGQLPFILSVSAILALPISFLLIRLYRRSVLKRMSLRSEKPADKSKYFSSDPTENVEKTSYPLKLITVDASNNKDEANRAGMLFRKACSSPWRAAFIYLAGGSAFAVVMTVAFLRSSHNEMLPFRFLVLFWVYAWPLILTLYLVAATGLRTKMLLVAAYITGFTIFGSVVLARSPDSSATQLIVLWLSTNLPATVLLLVFLLRKVRAVGPMVVTFMILALTGSNLLLSIMDRRQELLRGAAEIGFSLGLGGIGTFWALSAIGFLVFAMLGWLALQWIRRRYQAKAVNDQSLILDSLWLLFGISYSVGLVFQGPLWILSGVAAFAVYKTTVLFGFRTIAPADSTQAVSLLILRVFSLGKRSEDLFDAITRHWRYLGHIQLITGPDLVAATVEPHEFLAFLSGKLDQQFIDGPEALAQRLSGMDSEPDFDGRYRVNDFFCHDDTWRITLDQLVDKSDVVLMDLRGFSPQNAGCVYEVQELVNSALLSRVVMTTDDTTDADFLEKTLTDAWTGMRFDSPNRSGPGEVRIIRLNDSSKAIFSLLEMICSAAETTQPVQISASTV